MLSNLNCYILKKFFKYTFIFLITFIILIWISQVLRIIDLSQSYSTQLLEIILATLYSLPSFISPLASLIVFISCVTINRNFNIHNELTIVNQYSSLKNNKSVFLIGITSIFIFLFCNNELLSNKLYSKYKYKEIQIRNNFNLGSSNQNEFNIDGIVRIYFKNKENNIIEDVEALIINENQFIKAKQAEIEISKMDFNLVFNNGERIILNEIEKSRTIFDKFIYTVKNRSLEQITLDKEHFNTLGLLEHEDREFINWGHNRILNYLLTFIVSLISLRILYFNEKKKYKIGVIFTLILILHIINIFFLYLLDNYIVSGYFIYYAVMISLCFSLHECSIRLIR